MTTTTSTIAERILENLLGGDGCRPRTTRLGVDRGALLERCAVRTRTVGNGETIYAFRDGSEIETSGPGVDTPEGWRRAA